MAEHQRYECIDLSHLGKRYRYEVKTTQDPKKALQQEVERWNQQQAERKGEAR